MALVVEDGSGLPGAESYASVAEADAYFSARANEAWADVEDKEAALRKATDYIEGAFGESWKGYKATATQRLAWPRQLVPIDDYYSTYAYVGSNVVPERVKFATAELAMIASAEDLVPVLAQGQRSVTVGPISVQLDDSTPQTTRRPYIEMLLRPFLKGSNIMVGLIRT